MAAVRPLLRAMPYLYRTRDGQVNRPRQPISVTLADGTRVQSLWSGFAHEENLDKWLNQPGHELSQSEEVSAIAIREEGAEEARWGTAPPGARLLFVLRPHDVGRPRESQRIARLVTTLASTEEEAYYGAERSALFGFLHSDGSVTRIAPLPLPTQPTR